MANQGGYGVSRDIRYSDMRESRWPDASQISPWVAQSSGGSHGEFSRAAQNGAFSREDIIGSGATPALAELRGRMLDAAKETMGQKPPGPNGWGTGYTLVPLDPKELVAPTVVVDMQGIDAWSALGRIGPQLKLQQVLVARSPLREIPVGDGLAFISNRVGGWRDTELTKDVFVQTCLGLLLARRVPHTLLDRDELFDTFDSMDLDRNGTLSLGEWAGGLSVFFQGTTKQCVEAVFHTLDKDKSRSLSKPEFQEYIKPLVNAMTPPEADVLRPVLLQKATDDLFNEIRLQQQGEITCNELVEWAAMQGVDGNGVVERVAYIIECEVYRLWLRHRARVGVSRQQGQRPHVREQLQSNVSPGLAAPPQTPKEGCKPTEQAS